MTFDEILDQAIDILQRRGRVSYRALKAQFPLDDELLETLTEELIEVHQLAIDQDGKMLVWTGEAPATEQPAPPASQTPQLSSSWETQSAQPEVPLAEPHTPDAERRQLTVMFSDLADSTKLSGQLDPEDLMDVIRAYQETAASVIQRYAGHIAQYLGDGLLVYFGWPQAHEDDAQRSVHAGLGIIKDMGDLNTRLEKDKGVRLAVRIGIHTGPVVIGEMGGGGRHEQLALGETTNIASRLEGIAAPNTVVVSETTYRLVEGYFRCDDLGMRDLKGVATPMQTYQVRQETGVQGRLDAAMTRGLTPLVGRESEVSLLLERWQQVQDGQGQVVLLSGEAGIGKSRLVQVLKDHVAEASHIRLECRSSPYYQNTALYPITDLLRRALQWQQDDTTEEKLEKLEQMLSQYRLPLEETVPLFATVLSLPIPEDRYSPLNWTPQRQRQKTLGSIVAILLELAERQSVLFILEDLHWTDPTTLELLGLLMDQVPTTSILTMLTYRPEFAPPWGLRSHLTPIALSRFTRSQIETMIERVTGGKTLPAEVVQHLVEQTDGVPLYVEEMTKAILESDTLQESDGQYELTGPLASLTIPSSLQDSLMARLDNLGTAKGIAQLGATLGRTFTYELLQAVSMLDELVVWQSLVELVEAELLYQRGSLPQAMFIFKHALMQETAYQSLLRSTRQQVHQRIAQVLTEQFPQTAEAQPELLAHHYTEAGLNDQAVVAWQQAGQHAIAHSAYREAANHLRSGLEVLMQSPDTPERAQRELDVQLTLLQALAATRGYGAREVEQTCARAQALCQQVGEPVQRFRVLQGLWVFHHVRAEYRTAQELAEQLVQIAQGQHEPAFLLWSHAVLGATLTHRGEIVSARDYLDQGMSFRDAQVTRSQFTVDPVTFSLTYQAVALFLSGYPDGALRSSNEALTRARALSHPRTLAWALHWSGLVHAHRREWRTAYEQQEATIALSTEQGLSDLVVYGSLGRGMALAGQGEGEEGIAQIRQGLDSMRAMGQEVFVPFHLAMLSEAHMNLGQTEEGLTALAEALALIDATGECWSEAELHRLEGKFMLMQPANHGTEAEACFHHALDIARHQQAKSWELRTATSLARLWQSQGKRQDADDLLAPVYEWFNEGFDTADLQDAKLLLEALSP